MKTKSNYTQPVIQKILPSLTEISGTFIQNFKMLLTKTSDILQRETAQTPLTLALVIKNKRILYILTT
jgi:hypothetical protein